MNERHGQAKQQKSRPRQACPSNYSASTKSSPFKFESSLLESPTNKHEACKTSTKDHFRELRTMLDNPQTANKDGIQKHHTDTDEEGPTGLSLEVEIDESLRDLLQLANSDKSNTNKYNQSLDVTIIQQSDSQHQTTVSLGMEEVSQLIDMVHATGNNVIVSASKKDRNVSKEFRESYFKELPENVQFGDLIEDDILEYYTSGDTEDEYSDDVYERGGIVPPSSQQVYTSPQHTFNEIRSKLPCMRKSPMSREPDDSDKPGTPCMCQHCGMVGVLVESQKRPAIPHTPNPKFSGYPNSPGCTSTTHHVTRNNHRKIIDLRSKSKSETNLILLKELTSKIASLEDRLNEHEEQTINELRVGTTYGPKPSVNISTQYSKKNLNVPKENVKEARTKHDYDTPERDHNRIYPVKIATNQKSSTEDCNNITNSERYYKRVYKTKVAKRSANTSSTRNDILKLPQNLDSSDIKTVYMTNQCARSNSPFEEARMKDNPILPELQSKLSAHAIKNLCDMVYHKYCDTSKQAEKVIPEKLRKSCPGKSTCPFELQQPYHNGMQARSKLEHPAASNRNRYGDMAQQKRMDVSYVNPALKTWHDESEQEFATVAAINSGNEQEKCTGGSGGGAGRSCPTNSTNAAKNKAQPKHSIEEKIKYLRYLAKRKNVDEAELWTNILNQAKRHIKSNEDTVSIQLPNVMHGPDMSELELTLSKLKDIVKKSRNVKKNRSGNSIEYRTSSDCFRPSVHKQRRVPNQKIPDTDIFNGKRKNVTR